jgi:hypothetical protein
MYRSLEPGRYAASEVRDLERLRKESLRVCVSASGRSNWSTMPTRTRFGPSGSDPSGAHPQSVKFLWDITYLCWNLTLNCKRNCSGTLKLRPTRSVLVHWDGSTVSAARAPDPFIAFANTSSIEHSFLRRCVCACNAHSSGHFDEDRQLPRNELLLATTKATSVGEFPHDF